MNPDPTTEPAAPESGASHLFNISIRAWLSLIIVGTMCAVWIMGRDLNQDLFTLGAMVIGFYFGQHTREGQK